MIVSFFVVLMSSDINENVTTFLNGVANICIIDEHETQPQACNQGIVFSTGMKLLVQPLCSELPSLFPPLSLSLFLSLSLSLGV